MRLLVSGDGRSERDESEVEVVAEAELPGRLEGIEVGRGERAGVGRRNGNVGRESRDEERQEERNIIRELISLQDRVRIVTQLPCKLCV